jgi:cell wall-associated NlpC family hydrolase
MSSSTMPASRLLLIITGCAILLGACGHEPVRRASVDNDAQVRVAPRSSARSPGERAAVVALRQIGVPYRYGGASRAGFDCSGLVRYSYGAIGTNVPRSTADQWRNFTPVPKDKLQVGDVIFFRIKGSISHVGIYVGDKRFVHAPSTGRSVGVASLGSGFYRKAFVRGGRPVIRSN